MLSRAVDSIVRRIWLGRFQMLRMGVMRVWLDLRGIVGVLSLGEVKRGKLRS